MLLGLYLATLGGDGSIDTCKTSTQCTPIKAMFSHAIYSEASLKRKPYPQIRASVQFNFCIKGTSI